MRIDDSSSERGVPLCRVPACPTLLLSSSLGRIKETGVVTETRRVQYTYVLPREVLARYFRMLHLIRVPQ